jgi:hypothetical protein
MTPLLTIRNEQLAVLAEQALRRDLEGRLARAFPQRCAALGPGELGSRVRGAIERGRRYGLKPRHLIAFAGFELVFGEAAADAPGNEWAAAILRDKTFGVDARIQKLREAAIFRVARESEEAEWQARQDAADAESAPSEPTPD